VKTVKITKKIALEAMTRAMDERGEEFRFTDMFEGGIGCFYSGIPKDEYEGEDGDGNAIGPVVPACLVGLAFHLLDPDLDGFLSQNNEEAISHLFKVDRGSLDSCPAEVSATGEGVTVVVTRKAMVALNTAQECQDGGGTWGEALTAAQKAVK